MILLRNLANPWSKNNEYKYEENVPDNEVLSLLKRCRKVINNIL